MIVRRLERWEVYIPPDKEMNLADVESWINGKAKGNLKVRSVKKSPDVANMYEVEVWRIIGDYPDTIKAM